jgi:hypothetical protein
VICAGNDVSDMYMTLAAARRLVRMSPMGVLVIRGDCRQAPRHLFSALKSHFANRTSEIADALLRVRERVD